MAKKLIEVSLPLEEINKASAREKSIRHGHPSTLHLWWARRPLAAARAVIFSSLITDPSDPEYPWRDGQTRDIEEERKRLHDLIIQLVQWENSTDEELLKRAREEILLHTNGNPPPLLDPFAGGGSIPLEAQRLGLEAHASDLNPVAVLINKAMIELPSKFADQPSVNPDQHRQTSFTGEDLNGLANDIRYYGQWMRDEAERRIGHLYPKVKLPAEQGGGEATVIAWLWARTVTCPNPACGAEMPLVRSFTLSKKKGKEAYVVPRIRPDKSGVDFEVSRGKGKEHGTVTRTDAKCLVCGQNTSLQYIRSEGAEHRMSYQLMAIVAEGSSGRIYAAPTDQHAAAADVKSDQTIAATSLPERALGFRVQAYGMTRHRDLFTERQLVALATFSDLVNEVRGLAVSHACEAGLPCDGERLADGGTGAEAYADAVATYLAFAVDRLAESMCTLARWQSTGDFVAGAFGRQALPMVWDFADVNPFSSSTRNFGDAVNWVVQVIKKLPAYPVGYAKQANATLRTTSDARFLVSTDPPYYDNIGYADLSDFFYVWLRKSLIASFPDLLATLLVPKAEELVATPYRFKGGRREAEQFFETGLKQTFKQLSTIQSNQYPMSVYYAFKQSEAETGVDGDVAVASTGWETMLEGLIKSGFQIVSTWPMRTERGVRMIAIDTNSLASSIVLACRVRPQGASEITRQQFLRELRSQLAKDLKPLRQANIAPVDLAQAAIGPGMAIYSKYSRVREASGKSLRVREALALINQVLDEVLAEQDEEYDEATRWAISWYEQYGMNEGPYGDAEGLARARNVVVGELARHGLVRSGQGKVRFVWREEYEPLPVHWQPRSTDISDWVIMQRLATAVQSGQQTAAALKAKIDTALPGRTNLARDLAYRAYNIAERKRWSREALIYNTLIQNWSAIEGLTNELSPSDIEQQTGMNLQ